MTTTVRSDCLTLNDALRLNRPLRTTCVTRNPRAKVFAQLLYYYNTILLCTNADTLVLCILTSVVVLYRTDEDICYYLKRKSRWISNV
jgi:hypothetical protein